ncbi:hypothetical protein [Cupriavidus necator]|uniref:glycosyltransferase family protein n=1 Tax=Cupriavidus necator TaxID=106590 RepID=UPI00339D8008
MTTELQKYVAFLTNQAIDRHQHNHVFTTELSKSFAARNIGTRTIDYIATPRHVTEAALDPNCLFFICYNGFGSELLLNAGPGDLRSLFSCYNKRLFDLMHDCPVHESMSHQHASTGDFRTLLITDHSYAHIARMLGIRHVYFVPSITFPGFAPDIARPISSRDIEILLPVGLTSPSLVTDRFSKPRNFRQRILQEIFHAVTEKAVDRLDCDPLSETMRALSEAGLAIHFDDPDLRFLVTTILDFVKFSRRQQLVYAIQHLPVTVISDRKVEAPSANSRLRCMDGRTFPELIETMARSKSILCPLPHHSGFHERALAAFSTGAAVIASPNELLETNFSVGEDLFVYRTLEDLTCLLEDIVAGRRDINAVSENGRTKAMAYFPPARISNLMLSLHASLPDSAA